MSTTTTKPDTEVAESLRALSVPDWPSPSAAGENSPQPSHRDALQALLAFSALHDQVRRRRALAVRQGGFDTNAPATEFELSELFVLDEVLQLVAERAVGITGADGLAIALAENNEIVLRAAAGTVRPDIGARIDRDSAFSGACFRTAQVILCDDTEIDHRVNIDACRKLGARSMVAVPLCGRRRVIGVLEAFSAWPFGFNDSDVRNLTLLAELVLAALKPEDEDRFVQSAQVAATKLEPTPKSPAVPKSAASIAPVQAAATHVRAVPSTQPVAGRLSPAIPVAAPVAAPAVISPKTVVPPVAPKPAEKIEPKAPAMSDTKAPVPAEAKTQPKVEPKPAAVAESKAEAKAETKVPAATEAKASPAPAVPEKPEVKPAEESIKVLESPRAQEKAVEPALTFGQIEPGASSRRWIPIVLVSIVIAAAAGAGIWWKVKTAQLGDAIVHTKQMPVQPTVPEPAQSTAASDTNANPAPEAATDNSSDTTALQAAPATPQELAKFPRVTGVRHWSAADSSTVVLDLEDQVQYEPGHLSNPDRVYFDLRDTQLVPELQNKSFDGDALLNKIRVAQPVAGVTRVVLEAKGGAMLSQPQVSLERDPYRLVIKVTKAGVTPKAVNLFPNAPSEKKKLAIVLPPPTKEDLQLRARVPKLKIVVDAGHGGWDLGTVGRRGLLEKDLVFEISERLGRLLESRLGWDVIYTRPDDNYVTLDERAEIANQSQADLFVSVHANYSDLPSARGVETYYTNFFSAPGANPPDTKGLPAKIADKRSVAGSLTSSVTLSPADLHDRIEQSRRLASSVQRSLYGTLSIQNSGLRDRGVREAAFVVLTESAMPGILAEVSFVSSPADEQRLRSDGYREQIAEAIYRGIARYAAASRTVKVAEKQAASGGGQ